MLARHEARLLEQERRYRSALVELKSDRAFLEYLDGVVAGLERELAEGAGENRDTAAERAPDHAASTTGNNTPATSAAPSIAEAKLPDGSSSWQDFRSGADAVEWALALLGYENLGGDHGSESSAAFLVAGLNGQPKMEIALGWEWAAPMGGSSARSGTPVRGWTEFAAGKLGSPRPCPTRRLLQSS